MKGKIYYIPGLGETKNFKYSKKIIESLERNGEVIPIKYISKKGTTPRRNIKMIMEQIKRPTKNDILIGFSMGAVFAYILNTKIKFKKVIICSIPAILENDLDKFSKKEVSKIFSSIEIKEFSQIKYTKPKNLTIFICGDKENKETIEKSKCLAKKFKCKSVVIKNAKHELGEKYVRVVSDLTKLEI